MLNNKVTIYGNVFGIDGYSCHTRFLAETLDVLGVDVSIECPKQAGWEFGCPDR